MADAWLENMIEEIRAKEIELNSLKRAANTFFRSKNEPEPFNITDPDADTNAPMRFRPDEFYGKGFATAARLYMERRKQAVSGEDVTKALDQGGFDYDAQGWKKDDRVRIVAMSLAKNTNIFHRLPNGLFGLKEWYPEAIERKKGKKAEAEVPEE
jgi:hypothetical protein